GDALGCLWVPLYLVFALRQDDDGPSSRNEPHLERADGERPLEEIHQTQLHHCPHLNLRISLEGAAPSIAFEVASQSSTQECAPGEPGSHYSARERHLVGNAPGCAESGERSARVRR